ncbi:MAG TPA: SAM-dependent chlorinase/fluorinase [Pyrinomonadaceae bacterium]|nr:SAM-dependent chlorinase/fluorinase [Pyrinomonadaceae bacterium]
MKPPIITLLTDFGSQDYFVGAMKGAILSVNPAAQIVDITHETPPQDIEAAAFNLLATYKDFPAGTIHVAVVDPGVGSTRKPILIECGKQFFVGPDNGIFSWICEREGKWRAIHLTNEEFFRHPVSATFHGRDIFAPVAAALASGVAVEDFGDEVSDYVRLNPLEPVVASDGSIDGRVIHIDRFGNCITNLTRANFSEDKAASGAKLRINGREISSFGNSFSEAAIDEDDLFCLVGSAGFLEIVARNSSAARLLNAERGHRVIVVTRPH